MIKMYYVYILASDKNHVLYVGVTNDLIRRVTEHKSRQIKGFASSYNVTKLVYFEFHTEVNAAIQREKAIKRWQRSWKECLIGNMNPSWKDLYEDILNNLNDASC